MSKNENVTLVSGFINLEKRDYRDISFYIEKGIEFLRLPYNKVIFLEKEMIELLREYENENTKFVLFDRTEIFLWKHREEIHKCELPRERNNEKDTHDYMILMHQKTDWIRRAIERNDYGSEQYIWMDFGIYHIVKNKIVFEHAVRQMITKTYDKIRIAGCWNLSNNFITYDKIMWYFCGGLFGGRKEMLLQMNRYVNEECLEFILQKRWMWEVNTWYFIYKKQPELFDWYLGDHNVTMILNY